MHAENPMPPVVRTALALYGAYLEADDRAGRLRCEVDAHVAVLSPQERSSFTLEAGDIWARHYLGA